MEHNDNNGDATTLTATRRDRETATRRRRRRRDNSGENGGAIHNANRVHVFNYMLGVTMIIISRRLLLASACES